MAQATVEVRVHRPSDGQLLTVITNWRTLNLERVLNHYSNMALSLNAEDPRVAYFTLDALLAVWRKVPGEVAYLEDVLFHRTPRYQQTETNLLIFTSYSRGLVDLLRRRHILYNSGSSQAEKTGPGETVMKAYVDQNAGPAAIAPRKRVGTFTGLSIEASGGLGATWDGNKAWQNLLEVIEDISLSTGVDFDIVPNSNTVPNTFTFRTYYPQRGTDRTASVTFSNTYANMLGPSYTLSRAEEVNAAIVLGQGQESRRRVVVREDAAAQAESPWNSCEATADGRNNSRIAQLNSIGDQLLEENKAEEQFTFDVLQGGRFLYGRDYNFGDKVNAQFLDIRKVVKIVGVTLNVQDGEETVKMRFSNVSA